VRKKVNVKFSELKTGTQWFYKKKNGMLSDLKSGGIKKAPTNVAGAFEFRSI